MLLFVSLKLTLGVIQIKKKPLYKCRCMSVGINIFRYALLILAYRRLHEQRDFFTHKVLIQTNGIEMNFWSYL